MTNGERHAAREPADMRHASGAQFRSNFIGISRSHTPLHSCEIRALCFQQLTDSFSCNSCASKRVRIPGGRGATISKPCQIMTFQIHDRRTNQHACADEPCPGRWRAARNASGQARSQEWLRHRSPPPCPLRSFWPPVTSHESLVTDHGPPVTSHQSPAIGGWKGQAGTQPRVSTPPEPAALAHPREIVHPAHLLSPEACLCHSDAIPEGGKAPHGA